MGYSAVLHSAKVRKDDEFYTQLRDVEAELGNYKQHFKGKTVLCNCDNPEWSAFWEYFHLNFGELGLRKLVSTFYDGGRPVYKMEYVGGDDVNVAAGVRTALDGDGDFRSQECLDILNECDIVVTNPPFSLFREFMEVLIWSKKKFLVIGSVNAITYKGIFPLIENDAVWLGCKIGEMHFKIHKDSVLDDARSWADEAGQRWRRLGNVCWFTNLEHAGRRERLVLCRNYVEGEYPKYDNYDAINVNKVSDIPLDYAGVMGVPVSFLGKYNPEQFEIVAFRKGDDGRDLVFTRDGKKVWPYFRVLIRRRNG